MSSGNYIHTTTAPIVVTIRAVWISPVLCEYLDNKDSPVCSLRTLELTTALEKENKTKQNNKQTNIQETHKKPTNQTKKTPTKKNPKSQPNETKNSQPNQKPQNTSEPLAQTPEFS